MFNTLQQLLGLIRFSHTIFALPFVFLSAVMAWSISFESYAGPASAESMSLWRVIRWQEILGILLCMVFARSAAMAFNRVVDRDIDAENPRTKSRHLVVGALQLRTVIFFATVCSLLFIASTFLFWPNKLPAYLSVPVLLFLLGYSYTKRFTSLAHFWLGVSLALAPIAAWIALRGESVLRQPSDLLPAFVLGIAVFFWVAGFDIIYACQDAKYDKKAQLRSIPAKIGVANALRLAAICHLLTIATLLLLPVVFPLVWMAFLDGCRCRRGPVMV